MEALFPDGEAEKYIDLLRQVNPPIIGENDRYRLGLRQKGAFVAWAQIVRDKFARPLKDAELARLLNLRFPKLDISERSLRNTSGTAYTHYSSKLKVLLS